jgi:FtsZ-interacting cell division protein YlmF
MYGNSAPLTVAIWGLSLALLLAVSVAAWLVLRPSKHGRIRQSPNRSNFGAPAYGLGELGVALEDAAELNRYSVSSMSDPGVHLASAIRFTPLKYQNSASEIMQKFRDGRVVSIDLGRMDAHEAGRLVDFCSGMAAVNSGWIFRVTDKVIVLTPLA